MPLAQSRDLNPDAMTDTEKFRSALTEVIGAPLWGSVAGSGTGSMVNLRLGEKIPLKVPVKNPHLPPACRNNDSEWSLFIEHAAWRVESKTTVLCSSRSSNLAGEEMLTGLSTLVDSVVTDVQLRLPGGDMEWTFSNDHKLHIFCDCVNEEEGDNYSFFTRTQVFTVLPMGGISMEERKRGHSIASTPRP